MRRLTTVWFILLGLALVNGLAFDFAGWYGLRIAATVTLAFSSLLKGWLILLDYLGLRTAPDWKQPFLAILCAMVGVIYALALVRLLGIA
ncbi:MAG: hypothetical protein KDJ55_05520 [Rhodobiaceae bacterium]|nr:hypothetical protein [Rhodobiaceae bacterium]MCC0051728.1 hypothetical protein [Rhodobiaceae bacterium]